MSFMNRLSKKFLKTIPYRIRLATDDNRHTHIFL